MMSHAAEAADDAAAVGASGRMQGTGSTAGVGAAESCIPFGNTREIWGEAG